MNSQNPGYKTPKAATKNKNQKGRAQGLIIIFFSVIIGITVLCFSIMAIIKNTNTPQNIVGNTIIFHEANYDYDIMKD